MVRAAVARWRLADAGTLCDVPDNIDGLDRVRVLDFQAGMTVTSARSDSISADCSATIASSSAFRAASSSYEGCSGHGIPEPNHDHKLDASTDTPQINRRPDWLPPSSGTWSWYVYVMSR